MEPPEDEAIALVAQEPNERVKDAKGRRVAFWAMVALGVIMSALVVAFNQQWKPKVIYGISTLAPGMKSLMNMSDCNGNGVRIGRDCICDLGWRGSRCTKNYPLLSPSGPIRIKTILLVVDFFSPIDVERENSIYYTTLAAFLVKSGYKVTVLITGPQPANFEQLKKLYASKHIELLVLPEYGIRYEGAKVTGISHETMKFITEESAARGGPWEILMMMGGRGVAYHTLLGQKQGLLCIGSHMVIGLDAMSPMRKGQLQRGSKTAVNPEIEDLAADWMQQRATEMADTVISSSKALLDYAVELGWRVPEHVYILPYMTVPVATEKSEIERADELIPARQSQVKEFVFIGGLGVVGGLGVFLNALDNILSRDQKAHRKILKDRQIKVAFYGWNDVANEEGDLTGEHYIEMRSYAWGNRIKYTINNELHLKKFIKYMTEAGKGRVAVIPTLCDSTSFVLHQSLRAGVPVIASNLKSAQELVHIQDRREVLFATGDIVALAKRMIDVFNNGILLGRPQAPIRQYESQWRQLLADVHARPLQGCPSENFSLAKTKDPSDPSAPLITIVMTHYNRHKLLQQAIESLEKQTFKDYEVILVDDGSTDPEAIKFLSDLSWVWWQERAWKVLREPNRYLGAARNTGARLARGKYILFMDDDDIAKPGQLDIMFRVAEISGADVVTTGHDLFSSRNYPRENSINARYLPLGGALNAGVLKNVFGDSNMLVHRQFFVESGGFTEEYGVGFEDYEFLARVVARDNHLEALAEPMHWYRQHAGTMSLTTDLKAGQLRYMRAYMEVYQYLPKLTQSLLRYAQTQFFETDTGSNIKYALANTTTTSTTTTTTPPASSTITTTISTTTPFTSTTTQTSLISTTITELSSTFVVSTSSRQTFITSLMTPGGTCPCRSHRRARPTSFSSSRSTCTSTMTIHPTIRRTGRATTVTVTYTPTVTCNQQQTSLVTLPPPRFLAMAMDGNRLFYDLEDVSIMTQTSTMFLDAPPPRAPMAINAEYSSGGEYVFIQFDRPVNVELGRRFHCETFLLTRPKGIPNAGHLGHRPEDCRLYFSTPTEMRILLDPRYAKRNRDALAPGKLIIFREGTMSNADSLNRAFVSGSIEVAPPEDPDPPVVIVDAPSFVGACDEYVRIDLSKSRGAAGRPFIDAYFDFNCTALEHHFLETPLKQFLHSAALDAIKTGRLVIDIPTSLLTDYTAYTFSMSLWNIFGVGATGYTTVSKVSNELVPSVLIEGPSVARQDQPLQFSALLPPLVCNNAYNSTIAWSIISGPSRTRIKGSNRAAIVFEANALEPGDYVIGARLVINVEINEHHHLYEMIKKMDRNPASGSTYLFTHSFTVLPSEVSLEIAGGSRLIGYEDSTRLIPRIVGASVEEFNINWLCLSADRESQCEQIDAGEWSKNTTEIVQVINGKSYEKGTDIELTVTATHKTFGYQLMDSVVVAIAKYPNVPRVELAVEKYIVTTHQKSLRMRAAVAPPRDPAMPRNYTYYWESLPYCNRQFYAIAPVFSTPIDQVKWTSNAVENNELEPSTLLPGAEYCFRVAALDGNTNQVGWAFRTVRVREPPTAGYCELTSPAVGTAFKHRFTVACHGWSGPNLKYRFKTKMRGDPIPLSPASSQSQLSFTTDVGHYLLEVDIFDGDGLMTTVPVRNISARHGDDPSGKEVFLAEQLSRFEKSRNSRLGFEILSLTAANVVPSILAGQAPAKMAAKSSSGPQPPHHPELNVKQGNLSLSRILQVVDSLSQTTHVDATESGPYFLDYLQRILPTKLPIDLRPLLLKILLRISQSMSKDRAPDRCFAPENIIQILKLLGPIYENPRGGASASFAVHEIKNVLETCLQRTMYCEIIDSQGEKTTASGDDKITVVRKARQMLRMLDDDRGDGQREETNPLVFFGEVMDENDREFTSEWDGEPFSWSGVKHAIEFGLIDTRNVTKVARLCGFNLPDLRGITLEDSPCLGYRCAYSQANLMRNNSIDHNVLELSFRNATQTIAPWFRTKHLTFIMPLSAEFQKRVAKGGRPKCVWYDRFMNATASTWSEEGCQVMGFNLTHVQCACSHLTEFSILVPPLKPSYKLPLLIIILSILLGGLVVLAIRYFYARRRRKHPLSSWLGGKKKSQDELSRASTIRAMPSRTFSRSTLVASESSSKASTIFAPRTRRNTELSEILIRRPSQQPARRAQDNNAEPLRRTQSQQALWSRHDDERLRRERINQILQDLEDQT